MRGDETQSQIVSSDGESLLLVDPDDRVIGSADKATCHDGEGLLHRAFSVFVFNTSGDLLIQQRSDSKRLWPLFWSNSCCSHPGRNEPIEDAVDRRLREELGLSLQLEFVYKFEYRASYLDLGAEHELCWVFIGVTDRTPTINANEIKAARWVSSKELTQELDSQGEKFTPWFKMEWQRLQTEFRREIRSVIEAAKTPSPGK